MSPINKWVIKAQKGDDKAFTKLFQKYEADIYRMAFVYVKNQDDALDVVQEVAYQSFKKISTLREPEYFKSWLLRIAINCSIDLIKKRKKVVHIPDYEAAIEVTDKDIPLSLTLEDLVNGLKEEEKSVVLLKFYYDYTFKEISELLTIPIGTSKSILYRALEKLREDYSKGGGIYE